MVTDRPSSAHRTPHPSAAQPPVARHERRSSESARQHPVARRSRRSMRIRGLGAPQPNARGQQGNPRRAPLGAPWSPPSPPPPSPARARRPEVPHGRNQNVRYLGISPRGFLGSAPQGTAPCVLRARSPKYPGRLSAGQLRPRDVPGLAVLAGTGHTQNTHHHLGGAPPASYCARRGCICVYGHPRRGTGPYDRA